MPDDRDILLAMLGEISRQQEPFQSLIHDRAAELLMNRVNLFLAGIFLSAILLSPGMARAMDIKDYLKMADQDQGRFDRSLLTGAEKLLSDEGRTDLADRLNRLFTDVKAGNNLGDGTVDYRANLGAMAISEVRREAWNPNLPHLQAEKAFREAAENHGIPLPPAFDAIAGDFHPLFPPRPSMVTQNPDGTFTVQKESRNGNSKDAEAKAGLVIPPQVVVPLIPIPDKKH